MTVETAPAATVVETPAADAPAAVVVEDAAAKRAAEVGDDKAAETPRTFTQDEVNAIVQARLAKAEDKTSKTDAERIAALEAQGAASEQAAKNAIVHAAAASAHNPAVVAQLVQLDDLTSADADAIKAKVSEYLTANPYLVKADGAITPPVGIPGAGGGGSTEPVGAGVMSETEFAAVTPEDLAADENLMKRYMATLNAR